MELVDKEQERVYKELGLVCKEQVCKGLARKVWPRLRT